MHDAHEFLKSLTIVLGVAAVTTVVFQRLRQPVVLGYIIAGLIVGPHVPIPLVADPVVVQTLSELGVILLMFSLGLEFSLRRLAEVGPTAGLTALLETSFMIWLGFTIGRFLGWTGLESLFAGAVIGTALALSAPFCLGVVRVSQKLGVTLARLALPTEQRKRVDFAAAPRRMLVVTFQLAAVLLVGTPLLMGLLVAVLGVAFWRSATNLQGHVRAGAQVILEALTAQARPRAASTESDTLEHLHQLLPGLGALAAARLDPSSAAVGKTLAHLNLRGRTGATVLAVTRTEWGDHSDRRRSPASRRRPGPCRQP